MGVILAVLAGWWEGLEMGIGGGNVPFQAAFFAWMDRINGIPRYKGIPDSGFRRNDGGRTEMTVEGPK